MATHSSFLSWRIPWTEEPGRLQSMRSQRVRLNWATSTLVLSRKSSCSPWGLDLGLLSKALTICPVLLSLQTSFSYFIPFVSNKCPWDTCPNFNFCCSEIETQRSDNQSLHCLYDWGSSFVSISFFKFPEFLSFFFIKHKLFFFFFF